MKTKIKPINWNKICANAGVAFFSTLSGTALAGNVSFEAAIVSAIILAGLAFFTEMKLECEDGTVGKLQKIVSTGVLM